MIDVDVDREIRDHHWTDIKPGELAVVLNVLIERYLIGERNEDQEPTGRVTRDVLWRFDGTGVLDQHDAVWTVPAGGGAPVRRTSPDNAAAGVTWSPDASRIAFVGDRRPERTIADKPQLWTIAADGGNPSRVSPEGHVVIESR